MFIRRLPMDTGNLSQGLEGSQHLASLLFSELQKAHSLMARSNNLFLSSAVVPSAKVALFLYTES